VSLGRRICPVFLAQESSQSESSKRKHYAPLAAVLGWLGALNLFLLALYLLSTYQPLSTVPPMNKLALSIHLGATIITASAILLVYGGILMWTNNILKGGIVNLLAGALAPIPTYVYFAFFSQLDLLSWLGPSGFLLLAPATISGIIGIYAARSAWH
jgi:hypothetical protein